MSDDKIKIYQPKIAPVYPHPLTGDLVTICINREWLPLLQGFLHPLRWKSAIWEGTTEEVDLMHQYIEDLLSVLGDDENCAMDCDKISDLRIYQGKLQKKLCGSDVWQDVGRISPILGYENNVMLIDVDLDGSVDVTYNPTNPYSQLLSVDSLPPVTDTDRICRASWQLAESLCDDFADLVNTFGVGTYALTRLAEVVLSWTPAWVIGQFADETLDWFVEDLPIVVMQWLTSSARDPDTVSKVSEMIYCSLLDHYPNDLENVLADIPLGIYDPFFEIDGIQKVVRWLNFNTIAQSIYDTLTARFVAYLVIGFGRASLQWVFHIAGLTTPTEKTLIQAINTAEFFDSRDCEGFGCASWEFEMDFEQSSFAQYVAAFTNFGEARDWSEYGSGSGWDRAILTDVVGGNTTKRLVNYITVTPPETMTIIKLTLWYTIENWQGNDQMYGAPLGFRQILSGGLLPMDGDTSAFTASDGLHVATFEGNNTIDELLISFYGGLAYNGNPPNGTFTYKKLRIEGNGENPFEV